MLDTVALFTGVGSAVMFVNLGRHDFADTRRLWIAIGLLAVTIACALLDHYLGSHHHNNN